MNNKINLLFTMNQNYVMPCVVALTSIFENDEESNFRVFMLHSGIGDLEREKIRELAEKYKQDIKEIKVDEKYFSEIGHGRWSKETWYRLLVNEYIPRDLDRILYLDCDIIVTDSLLKFYNVDFEGKYIVTPIFEGSIDNGKRLNLPEDSIYFPAGFLLYNLNKINDLFNYEFIIEKIEENEERLKFFDMDLLNILLYDKAKIIHKDFYYIDEDRNFKEKRIPSIIHYSASKPWHNLIRGKYDDIWLKYLKLSPYSYLYDEKYSSLKVKFLRSRPVKFFIRTFLGTKVFTTFDQILPHKIHTRLRDIYRKYFK